MYEQNTEQITPQQGATNETTLGNFDSYFRWNEETRQYEMNARISPTLDNDTWIVVPSPVRDAIVNPDRRPAVGTLIYDLANTNLRANREKVYADELRSQAWKCLEIIGERLISESEDRGWCNEFDRIIDEVNAELPGAFQLPTREKEFEVTWSQTVTVVVDCSAQFTARNADEARDMAENYEDAVDMESIVAAVRYGNYEEEYDGASNFEVSEV